MFHERPINEKKKFLLLFLCLQKKILIYALNKQRDYPCWTRTDANRWKDFSEEKQSTVNINYK